VNPITLAPSKTFWQLSSNPGPWSHGNQLDRNKHEDDCWTFSSILAYKISLYVVLSEYITTAKFGDIRDFTTMRYINRLVIYLLTFTTTHSLVVAQLVLWLYEAWRPWTLTSLTHIHRASFTWLPRVSGKHRTDGQSDIRTDGQTDKVCVMRP